ncbi:hypothetical protein TRIUR3_10621 [Triticum urartu]|uniref:Uncharacterized protein n=1 Tax=Triticum urartu TaxID=4572 RepID=M8AP30_TRIUA|nr:hypothetical protein TRIUR3_10621 [Triticum urartu]
MLAQNNGWAGIVINGCVRDVDEINECDVGVRALGSHPMKSDKRGMGEKHVPVTVAGTRICDGEWLYADADDVVPIEVARSRFLDIIIDHFIGQNVIEVGEPSLYDSILASNRINKRKQQEVQYEGDPRFALPLMYIANLYESLVSDVNARLASLTGSREKTIGVALEAAGGLYRKLTQKFPKKGNCSFRRRELATSNATKTKFPELVVQEEKRVRFVVINGLVIIERPNNMRMQDAEWFKRLTGRNEVAISSRDYKFYSPRHKYRRTLQPVFDIPGTSVLSEDETSPLVCSSEFRPPFEVICFLEKGEEAVGALAHEAKVHAHHLK